MRTACSLLLAVLWAAPAWASPEATVLTTHAVEDGRGTITQNGSGTIVRVDKEGFEVLSCAHVIEHEGSYGSGRLTVTVEGGREHPARVVHYDRKRDLSLFRVETEGRPKLKPARIAQKEDYAAGLAVLKYGHPRAGKLVVSEGEGLSYSSTSEGFTNFLASAPSASGDSGGGVYRKSDGKLIGVVWGGRDDGLRAVRISEIHDFLEAARKRRQR